MSDTSNKIAFILECSPTGPDQDICKHVVARIAPGLVPVFHCLENKGRLLDECATSAQNHCQHQGCRHIFIVWDLRPSDTCLADEISLIRQKLLAEDKNLLAKTTLVCAEKEIESWLLADHRAINAYLGLPSHANKCRKPEEVANPKARLINIFRKARKPEYNEVKDAIRIARKIPDCRELRKKVPSFMRLARKLKSLQEEIGKTSS